MKENVDFHVCPAIVKAGGSRHLTGPCCELGVREYQGLWYCKRHFPMSIPANSRMAEFERRQTRAVAGPPGEYSAKDLPMCREMERQMIAEAERFAEHNRRWLRSREVAEYGAWRAGVRARMAGRK